MKRILIILISLVSFAVVYADEITDSTNNITSQSYRLFYESSKSAINAYREKASDVSRDTTFAKYLVDFAALCYNIGEYEESFQAMTEVSIIYKTVYGIDNNYYATSLCNLAYIYYELSNYDDAFRLGSKAVEIRKRILGTDHIDLADSYNIIGLVCYAQGRNGMALEYLFKALKIRQKVLGNNHPATAVSYGNIGLVYDYQGDFDKALEYAFKALEIQLKVLGRNHPATATSYDNIGLVFHIQGDLVKALKYLSTALEIRERFLGMDHPTTAMSYNNIGQVFYSQGDFVKALKYLSTALEIRERFLGMDHRVTAESYSNIGEVFYSQGDFVKALKYLSMALEIYERILGMDHPATAKSYYNIGMVYPDYDKAIEYLFSALEIRERILGMDHPATADSYNSIGLVYNYQGDYDKALEYYFKALEIRQKVLGNNHSATAISYYNIGVVFYNLGDLDLALKYHSKSLEIRKRALDTNHPHYIASLGALAIIYSDLGDDNKANILISDYVQAVNKNILGAFSGLTANERQMYWNIYRFTLNEWMPRFIVQSEMPNSSSFLYDNVALFSKGLLLSTELEMSKLIQESGDDEAEQMYSELRQNCQILNFQYSKPIAERNINCDSLERVSAKLERKLGSRVQEFGDFTKNLKITWKAVQDKLDDSDIAIEFLSYPENDSTVAYIALTLCKNDTVPLLTPLFTEQQLRAVEGGDHTYQNAAADSLIWGPLASRLEGKSHIYFSATGILHSIGIEYLPSMEGKECYRLSSTRELVTHKLGEGIKSATLFGGIDYDATYASIKTSAPSSTPGDISDPGTVYYAENKAIGPIIYKQGGRGGLDEYNSMRTMRYSVDSLPGSRKEIQAVSALLKESKLNVQDCDTITRNQASEESFKALSGQRRSLIHISTHGFYYDTIDAKNKGEHLRMMLMGDDRPSRSEDKSLLRCGLCFAGANQFLREMKNPADGQDEGILNALEIAQTDLRGLDLVVLSACQTALGDVVNGEGVFGLQRGFKKAGAKSILMSLWIVDDDITALLMTEFYKAWTSSPEVTKTAALKAAQEKVKEKYPNPHAWAGFILLDALD